MPSQLLVTVLSALLLVGSPEDSSQTLSDDLIGGITRAASRMNVNELLEAWKKNRVYAHKQVVSTRYFNGEVQIEVIPKAPPPPSFDAVPYQIDLRMIRDSVSVVIEPLGEPVPITSRISCRAFRIHAQVRNEKIPLYIVDHLFTPGISKEPAEFDVCFVSVEPKLSIPSSTFLPKAFPNIVDMLSRAVAYETPDYDVLALGAAALRGKHGHLKNDLKELGYTPASRYLYLLQSASDTPSAPFDGLTFQPVVTAFTLTTSAVKNVLSLLPARMPDTIEVNETDLIDRVSRAVRITNDFELHDLSLFDFKIGVAVAPRMTSLKVRIENKSEHQKVLNHQLYDRVRRHILSKIHAHLAAQTDAASVHNSPSESDSIVLPAFFARQDLLHADINDPLIRSAHLDTSRQEIVVEADLEEKLLFVETHTADSQTKTVNARLHLLSGNRELSNTESDTIRIISPDLFEYVLRVEHPFYQPVEHVITSTEIERGRVVVNLTHPVEVENRIDVRIPPSCPDELIPSEIVFLGKKLKLTQISSGLRRAVTTAAATDTAPSISLLPENRKSWQLKTKKPDITWNDRKQPSTIRYQAELVPATATRTVELQFSSPSPLKQTLDIPFRLDLDMGCQQSRESESVSIPPGSRMSRSTIRVTCPFWVSENESPGIIEVDKPRGFDILMENRKVLSDRAEVSLAIPLESGSAVELSVEPLPPLEIFFVEVADQDLDRDAVYEAVIERVTKGRQAFLYVSNGVSFIHGDHTSIERVLAAMYKMDSWGTSFYEELSRFGKMLDEVIPISQRLETNVQLFIATETYYTLTDSRDRKLFEALRDLPLHDARVFFYVSADVRTRSERLNGFPVVYCAPGRPIALLP